MLACHYLVKFDMFFFLNEWFVIWAFDSASFDILGIMAAKEFFPMGREENQIGSSVCLLGFTDRYKGDSCSNMCGGR